MCMMKEATMMFMMMMMTMTMISSVTAVSDGTRKIPLGLEETKLTAVLPKPLSDFSSIYDAVNNHLYISGGCDSINGNQFSGGFFSCSNLTNHHYMIPVDDLEDTSKTATFARLADMPIARYRHTAVLFPTSQKMIIVGGRNVIDDSIISTVDIYDIATDQWSSQNITNEKYLLSDNTGVEYMDRAYIFGGWNGSYTAQSTSFYIEINDDGTLNFTDIAALPTPRGDISSVVHSSPTVNATTQARDMYALVTGGFTHENNYCAALDAVEQYHFSRNEWITEEYVVDSLNVARGDKVLVRTNYSTATSSQELIYALGGERPIENFCNAAGEKNASLSLGTESVPIDDIEYYNILENTWTKFPSSELDVYRFRFVAVVDTQTNAIYTLGGQLAFSSACTCFPTSNEIYMYKEIFATADDNAPAAAPAKSPVAMPTTTSAAAWNVGSSSRTFLVTILIMSLILMPH